MNAIEMTNVSKAFPGFAIQNLTLAVPAGSICGLVGENGAGKSTAIRLMMNALRPDSGAISLLGVDSASPDFRRVKDDVGVVLDEAYFPDVLTARQVSAILARTYTRWDSEKFSGYLQKFSLPEGRRFKDFSRGMKMKLAIAAALSHQAKLLILDEATAGLDPIVRDEILDIFFSEFTRDDAHSILISSHILSDLEKLCDYIAFLHQGRLAFCDEKDRLLETYGIFTGTAEQADSLLPEAVVCRESSGYGGVRALVRRALVPDTLTLERAGVEDIILYTVKGAKQA